MLAGKSSIPTLNVEVLHLVYLVNFHSAFEYLLYCVCNAVLFFLL